MLRAFYCDGNTVNLYIRRVNCNGYGLPINVKALRACVKHKKHVMCYCSEIPPFFTRTFVKLPITCEAVKV